MIRRLHIAVVLVLSVLLLPAVAAAQDQRETVTFQLNGTSPLGTQITGTIVADRVCGADATNTTLTFNGIVNGAPVSYNAEAVERWLGNGKHQIEIVSTDVQGKVLGQSPLRTINIVQTSPGLVTVDGVPAAINGELQAPCSGKTSYTVTNAGQGSEPITQLPNTAGSVPLQPQLMLGALVVVGLGLLGVARLLKQSVTQETRR